MKPRSDFATISSVAQLLAVVLIVAALSLARDIFIPLALGLLLSFLLSPIVNRLERWGIHNIAAVIVTAGLTFLILAGGLSVLARELTEFVGELPNYKTELVTKARSVAGMTSGMGGSLDQLTTEVTQALEKPVDPDSEDSAAAEASRTTLQRWTDDLFKSNDPATEVQRHDGKTPQTPLYIEQVQKNLPIASWAVTAGSFLGPLATAGLVTVFALFMLIHREDLRDRIISVISHGNYVTTTEALDEVGTRISRYLMAQTIINTSYGFTMSIGLALVGLTMTEDGVFPNAILWGVLATCFRFVPYIGPFVSAAFPLSISLAVFPGYGVFLATLALIVLLELVSNNIIEPWLYGSSTGISAVAVIMAAVFWGWLWGPVGLLLSTPLTVCLVVLGQYVPRFRIFRTLLGEDVVIKSSIRFYQRLLADDRHRAIEILEDTIQNKGSAAACDECLIPAIKRLRRDSELNELSDEQMSGLSEQIHSILQEVDWKTKVKSQDNAPEINDSPETVDQRPLVMACPAHDVSESWVLEVMGQTRRNHWNTEILDGDILPIDMAQQIAAQNPVVAIIMVMPSGGFAQARFLCKTIRDEGYRGSIVIACLGKFKHFDKLFVRFRKNGATAMTTSFRQTRSKIDSLIERYKPFSKRPPIIQSPHHLMDAQ